MIKNLKVHHRLLSIVLCIALLMTCLPVSTMAATGSAATVADPETLTRPDAIYGSSTVNAGKVTVGKSVSDEDITVNGQSISLDGDNNFLVTISQSAQVMGLTSQSNVPVDVVFVLDTSGSMDDNDRAETMVTAANSAIKTLMSTNEHNRVAVVAFSSEGYGGGTSNGAAANVLSSLAHYTGDAATNHLRWVNSSGNTPQNGTGSYIAGRDTVTLQNRTVDAYRHGKDGGTNIQAGIIAGAKLLSQATSTTYTDPVSGQTVTRIPFLIILSDGQPTYTYSNEAWYNPTSTGQQGPGSGSYEGNGFIAAMTAAYYKGLITEHYYGSKANSDNRCYIYTMGVELESLSGDDKALAQITLDPKTYTTGDYAATNADSYWNYGNTANNNTKNAYYGWKSYYNNYQSGLSFGVRVNSGNQGTYVWTGSGTPEEYYELEEPEEPEEPREPQEPGFWADQQEWERYYQRLAQYQEDLAAYNLAMQTYQDDLAEYEAWLQWREDNFTYVSGRHYTFTAESIAASKKYVDSIAYNDQYFAADDVADMEAKFQELVRSIQQKAISVPTKVSSGDHDFDGYVTFTDPIGEYMEVKDMKGVVADGYFYQGQSFAEKLSKYGTSEADPAFDALILDVVKTRMNLTSSVVDVDDFLAKIKASENQAYYNSPSDYDNSIVWWGAAYQSGEDEKVQTLGFADNDTIEYIEDQKAAGTIPAGADYVCRSYFFYGEAGGANPNPDHEYLYFMVRVQRELTAPYRETVVISAPASLLSMEKVLITETFDDEGNASYTATVEHQEPARVVYEVGLWDTITAENVSYIVSQDYAAETVVGGGSVNYDPTTGTYNFFTNDWDRTQTLASHHRALAKATFDAAADNAFYTYQEDTLLVDAGGSPVTSDPAGTTAYYTREYYEWADDSDIDGTYAAAKKTVLIKVDVPDDAELLEKDGKWYIPKGTYTAATLVVNGDDTLKTDNATGSSSIVAHPHRTGDSSNSHYTVFLGNNGMLSLKANAYTPSKTVSANLSASATTITDDSGKPVKVGDTLTYTVEVKNVMTEAADITVTDYVPLGTAFVAGSAGSGTAQTGHTKDASIAPDANNVLTWVLKDVPAGAVRYVSFQVTVTEAAYSLSAVPGSIDNTATVKIGDLATVTTNTTTSLPYGKTVTDVNNQDIDGQDGFKVGDTLVYHIRFHNTATTAADVTVTDKLPAGTTFVSADNGGTYDPATGVVTWSFPGMAAGAAKTVSFRVTVNASAKIQATGTQPESGKIDLPNTATITVGSDPMITNTTLNKAEVGDMVIAKTVAGGDQSKTFTIKLTETSGLLDGTYAVKRGNADETVVFTAGKASVTVKHGEPLTIKGLPAGAIINVEEDVSAAPGYTPTYNTRTVTIPAGAATAISSVSVTNTYTLEPLTVTVKGVKKLSGTLPSQAVFGFVAEPDSANPVVGDPLTGEVAVKESGSYQFTLSPKTFTQPGVYKYTISEINGGIEGVTYDTSDHVLIITVTDNGNGTMSATATLDGSAFDLSTGAVSFSNTYTPKDVPLTVTAKKTLMVWNGTQYTAGTLTAGKFRFQITDKASGAVLSTGTNAADGKIVFNTFYFSADMLNGSTSKEFTFVVSEVVPELAKDPNMLYDTDKLEFKATLTLNQDGTLSVTVGSDSDGNVDLTGSVNFTNYSNPDSVEVKPTGTKTTTNAPAGVSFSFSVVNTANENEPAAGVGPANGSITFSSLSFTEPGTYTYWIKESNAGNTTNGITYDATRYLMKVTVTRNIYNRLRAEVTYWSSNVDGSTNIADYTVVAAAPAFHNEYNAGGYINLTATKRLSGRTLNAGEFAFKLIRQDTGNEIDGIVSADGTIAFSTLYYSADDIPDGSNSAVIHYVMSEVIPTTAKLPGVTYDQTKHDVYIRITDNGSGTITAELVTPDGNGGYTATGTTDTGVTFSNSYSPVNGDQIKFQIKKTLNGRDLRPGEFDFQLLLNGGVVDIATNDANGIVTFTRQIPASATPGTYKFTVKEAAGSLGGMSYSTAEFDVYVKVEDDGKGSIKATLVDSEGNALTENADGTVDLTSQIAFVNTYTPDDAPVQLKATKTLSGRTLRNKEFSFVVRKGSASGQIVATGSNDANGNILFSTFDITAEDMAGATSKTFTYYIMESNNNVPGITVDTTVFTAEVTVTDGGDGDLTANVVYKKGGTAVTGPTFQNTYTPESTQLPLVAHKTLTGKNLADKEFTFQLKNAAGTVLQTKQNDANGVITFDDLTFTAADMVDASGNKVMSKEFTYTVSEKAGSVATMDYDETVYTVKVTVTDDGNGNLSAVAAYANAAGAVTLLSFQNTYTPPVLRPELEGTKTIVDAEGNPLTGSKYPLNGFEFEVRDTEGGLITTATSDASGKITFTDFEFTAAGEYRFLISEKDTAKPGYSKDPTVWCVHLTVSYDADTGLLSKAGEYVHVAPENHSDISAQASETLSFINVYDPADVNLTLKLKKDLDGRQLHDHEFTFQMTDDATGLLVAETRNHANGDINFNLTYTEAGAYSYTITELIPETKLGGVDYSTEEYKVSVTVTDDGSGKLKAEVGSITLTGTDTVDLTGTHVFHNTYEADPAEVVIEATKFLEGKELKADAYTFRLVNADDPDETYTATNTADGNVKFDAISFTQVGEYEYLLSEVEGTEKGVTYDKRTYTVTVKVTDDGAGQLQAETLYTSSDGGTEADPVFHNTYKPAAVEYAPPLVKKIYEGGTMRPFDFVLEGEGFETQIKQNNDQGEVTFDKLRFEKAGQYTFTVTEKADANTDDILFDTNVYTLVFNVIDNKQGDLEVESITVTSVYGRGDLVFLNVHEDLITKKDVFLTGDSTVSVDGKTVKTGDILTYAISYTNYTGKAVDITVTDTIPQNTAYVDGSADNGGVYADGVITWNVSDIAPNATVTVTFKVKVTGTEGKIENTAKVIEGNNSYETNTSTNPVTEPDPVPTPDPDTPKTGDEFQVYLWLTLLLISFGGMICTGIYGFREKKNAN